ncbi:D-TA family PLP-dependent enzyme [soil metagenome]
MYTLPRPQAIVLEDNCRRNIHRMADKALELGAKFRPHFKTHQSIEIGKWFREAGISGITVSTPEMAEYFIDGGWDDITIGFPFYPGQIEALIRLSDRCHFRLFVHDPDQVRTLSNTIKNHVSVLIEIDAGYNRSGVSSEASDQINSIIEETYVSDKVNFHGFYIHDGDTYKVQGKEVVAKVIERNLRAFSNLKEAYPDASLCLGDTPSSSLLTDLTDIDELSPGNLVFYDLMQINIGSCGYNDIGLLLKTPVAQEKPEADECIIHGGAVHFSKDRLTINGNVTYGQPVVLHQNGTIEKIEDTSLIALSQEHGTIKGLRTLKKAYGADKLTEVWICPVHSCLTANLFREYHSTSGTVINKRLLS